MSWTITNLFGGRNPTPGQAGEPCVALSSRRPGARPPPREAGLAELRPGRLLLPYLLIFWLLLFAQIAPAATDEVQGRVVQVTVDGLYVDVGSDAGVKIGDRGMVLRGSAVIGSVQASTVSKSSALLQLQSRGQGELPRPGDQVVFEKESKEPEQAKPEPAKPGSTTVKRDGATEPPFVPLLAPASPGTVRAPEPANLFHGRAWLRQQLQVDPDNLFDYSITRFGTGGTLDRMAGTPWAADWDAELSYRDGQALQYSRDYQTLRVDLRRLSLFRRFDQGSFVRFGRFLPMELPSVGYLDGGQGDFVVSDHVRLGGMLGLKPDRVDLDFSTDEPTAVAYGTLEAGERRRLYYSGTLGLLGAAYRGEADRLALLFDQRAALSRYLNLYATMEMDMDVGGAVVRDDLSLTRLNMCVDSPVTSWLSLRAGVDHYQTPDTQAQRDILSIPSLVTLDQGYWRYWVGSSQRIPWNLSLDEELAFLDATDYDLTPLWRLGLTRRGIFSMKDGRVSLTFYNMKSSTLEGYGARLYGYLSFLKARLSFQPALGFRVFEETTSGFDLDLTDVSLQCEWSIAGGWGANALVSYNFGTSVEATYLDLGLTYRW